MTMTWGEFKKFVDEEIKKHGQDDNIVIEYIDISYPDACHESTTPYIGIDDDNSMGISC